MDRPLPEVRPHFDDVLEYIRDADGVTGAELADIFPVESMTYGRQRYTSTLIARYRSAGFIEDCSRCETCKRALTRGLRNVPLIITEKGREYLRRANRG
jgi:hypothetical protein